MEFSGQFSSPYESKSDNKSGKSEKSASSRPASFEHSSSGPKSSQEGVIQLHHSPAETISRASILEQFLKEDKAGEDRRASESKSEAKERPAVSSQPDTETPARVTHPQTETASLFRPPEQQHAEAEAHADKKEEGDSDDDTSTASTSDVRSWPTPPLPPRQSTEARTELSEEVADDDAAEETEEPTPEAGATEDLPPVPRAESVDDLPTVGGDSRVFAMPDAWPGAPTATPATGGGGARPPFGPPPGPPSETGGFGSGPSGPEPAPRSDFYPSPVFTAPEGPSTEAFSPAAAQSNMELPVDPFAASRAELTAEQRGLRRGLVAGFITGYVLKQFLANRKMRRMEAAHDKQFKQQEQQIYGLQGEQIAAQNKLRLQQEQITQLDQAAREQAQRQQFERGPNAIPGFGAEQSARPASAEQPLTAAVSTQVPFERISGAAPTQRAENPFAQPGQQREAAPQPGVPLEQQAAADLVAQAFELAPEQHVQQSTWHNIIVDERGREVQGAINYGEAFQHERQKEQVVAVSADDTQQRPAADQTQPGGATGYGAGASFPMPSYGADNPLLQSGQLNPPYQLQPGRPESVDPQHRLPDDTRPPVAALLTNPWIWVGLAVLLIAFFVAALA